MTTTLPRALRARFDECIMEGLSGRSAAARLKLLAATGVRWLRRLREQRDTSPDHQGRPKGYGKLAPHCAFLEDLVTQDGGITLPELAETLKAATGVVAHSASIGRFVSKLGYTYQKVVGCHRTASRARKKALPQLARAPFSSHASAS